MGGCQNYSPFLGTLNITCRPILGTQKGTIVLTTTHIKKARKQTGCLGFNFLNPRKCPSTLNSSGTFSHTEPSVQLKRTPKPVPYSQTEWSAVSVNSKTTLNPNPSTLNPINPKASGPLASRPLNPKPPLNPKSYTHRPQPHWDSRPAATGPRLRGGRAKRAGGTSSSRVFFRV